MNDDNEKDGTQPSQPDGTLFALVCGLLFAERVVECSASNACIAEEHPRAAAAFAALAIDAQASTTSFGKLWSRARPVMPLPSVTHLPPALASALNLSNAIERSADLVHCLTEAGDDVIRGFCEEWLPRRSGLSSELKEALSDQQPSDNLQTGASYRRIEGASLDGNARQRPRRLGRRWCANE